MTVDDDALIPISALQHVLFCERQAALIHVEKTWIDNTYTVEGTHAHRRVHDTAPRRERRGDLVILRGLWLRSDRLGLIGRADAVEIHRASEPQSQPGKHPRSAVPVHGLPGLWRFAPVEYKRGRPKQHRADEVQLCAQAMCIEEMNQVRIDCGDLFYGRTQRRLSVEFDPELRGLVQGATERMRHLIETGTTPNPVVDSRCERCSMAELCLPCSRSAASSTDYTLTMIRDHLDETGRPCDST